MNKDELREYKRKYYQTLCSICNSKKHTKIIKYKN